MPTFTWNIDPVFFRFTVPLFWVLLVVAALGASAALHARHRRDQSGTRFGTLVAAASGIAAFIWRDSTPELELRYYSLLFVLVFLGGYALLHWQIRRGGGDEEEAGDFIVYGVLGVLAGARLGHVLFYDLDKALRDPVWVLEIWTGGLASHGAVVGLIIAMYLYAKRRGIPFLEGSDRFSFSAALGAALVRLGNFFNSEIVGRVTDQSWGVKFPRYLGDARLADPPLRHPSQLYELALGLVVLGALLVADRVLGKERRPRGALIALFFALYFTGRFCIEFVKEFQTLPDTSTLTMGQWLSLPGAALGYYGLWWSFKQRLPTGWVTRAERAEQDQLEDEEDLMEETDDGWHDADVDAEFGVRRTRRPRKRKPPVRRDADEESAAPVRVKRKRKKQAAAEPDAEARPRKKRKKRKKRQAARSRQEAESAQREGGDSAPEPEDSESPPADGDSTDEG